MSQEIKNSQMLKQKRFKNKKAISEVIAYVLLIMLALSLSIGVYAFLKNVVWKEPKKCPDNLALVLADYSCNFNTKEINMTLQNKGLFNVTGFTVKINNGSGLYYLSLSLSGSPVKEIFFLNQVKDKKPLRPNEQYFQKLSYLAFNNITQIEIQPFIKEKKIILCESILKQAINNC